MGLFGKAVRYSVPKVSVNRHGVRFGNHFGGVSSSWSGNPRADVGVGPARARLRAGRPHSGPISGPSSQYNSTYEFCDEDFSGTRIPIVAGRERRPTFGQEVKNAIRESGCIALVPPKLRTSFSSIILVVGLSLTIFFVVLTRLAISWFDVLDDGFLVYVVVWLCVLLVIVSPTFFALAHLALVAPRTPANTREGRINSLVLLAVNLFVLVQVPNPSPESSIFRISTDSAANWLYLFPISLIGTVVSARAAREYFQDIQQFEEKRKLREEIRKRTEAKNLALREHFIRLSGAGRNYPFQTPVDNEYVREWRAANADRIRRRRFGEAELAVRELYGKSRRTTSIRDELRNFIFGKK